MKICALPLIAASFAFVGCSKGHFSESASLNRKVLTYALDNPITTLDPGKVQDIDMGEVLRDVFEGLVAYDEHNRIVPQLAKSWKVSNHDRTYTFVLRPEAVFSDGTAVTAQDFLDSWKRNLSPALKSHVARDYLQPIVGVAAFADGKSPEIAGVRVVNPGTLSITLDKPRPYFLGSLTYPCTFAIANARSLGAEIGTPEHAVGSGPFRLSRAIGDQQIDLAPNERYYLGRPELAGISRPVIKDPATRLAKFRSGELDQVSVPREDLATIQRDPELSTKLQLQPRPALFYFYLNERAYPAFRDVRVRRAFAMGLNRAKIVNVLLPGFAVATGILPPGIMGFRRDYKGVAYDPTQARRTLAGTPFGTGQKLPPVELAYRDGSADARIAATAAAESLKESLGVQVRPRGYEWGTLLELRNQGKLQMVFSSWYADYLDPQNFLSMLLVSGMPQNTEGWSDPKFDMLCKKADEESNQDARIKWYQEAEDIAVQQVAKLPLYFQRDAVLLSPHVKGMRTNLFGDLPHWKVVLQ